MEYKIYYIIDTINQENIYVGSTKLNLDKRLKRHHWSRNGTAITNIAKIMKNRPISEFKIYLLEECPSNIKSEREQFYIDEISTINKNNADGLDINNHKQRQKKYSSESVSCSCGKEVQRITLIRHKRIFGCD